MIDLLMLATGGGLGAVCRFAASRAIGKYEGARGFPWATLLINILGSLGLGALLAMRFGEVPADPYGDSVFLFLGVGFFAAFTTFSTFAAETLALHHGARQGAAAVYVVSTLVGCLGAFVLGFSVVG